MEPITLMALSGISLVVFFLLQLWNFGRAMKNIGSSFDSDSLTNTALLHVVFGALTSMSLLALIGSFIWYIAIL